MSNPEIHPQSKLWWVHSAEDAPWAGLRVAIFLPPEGRTQLVQILGIEPARSGPRNWDAIRVPEGWHKLSMIHQPRGFY